MTPSSRTTTTLARIAALALAVASATGCQGLSGSFAQWRSAYDSGLARPLSADELARSKTHKDAETDNLLKRWLSPRDPSAGADPDPTSGAARNPDGKILGSDGWGKFVKQPVDEDAQKELDAAFAHYEEGRLSQAESAFSRIARARKGTAYAEKALFYLAETQFRRKKYVAAHETYDRLFAEHPGTLHLDELVSREYEIAQIWLAQSDPEAKPDQKLPWYTHFTGEQPVLDASGMALKALEHVRHRRSDGPLADDALMHIADFHMKSADYESAALYYDEMIEGHPKSPFAYRAYQGAIDARMKAYLGPDYDGEGLEQARDLVLRAMRDFPEEQANNEKLFHTLDLINDQDAERTFNTGAYYKKIGQVPSAEYYFGKIPRRWADSPWAVKAKAELETLAKAPRRGPTLPSKILVQPHATDPYYSAGMGGMGAMTGMGGMGGGMGGSPGGML
ncbi:tetratricopeptide repeat protein [Paludisphaera sp.]|uniref:tetratricopeptide repeat protein n=1 Tax=Paludisphaera sp. TaxID=2017432 RepID=UPI00301C304F